MTMVLGDQISTAETHNTRPYLNTPTAFYPFDLQARYAYNQLRGTSVFFIVLIVAKSV